VSENGCTWFLKASEDTWTHVMVVRKFFGHYMTKVNLANVQDEGLRIGGVGHRMNSKVKISQTRHVSRINVVVNLAYSQSIPDRPLLAPIYRWPGLKEPVGSDTYYNVCFRHGLVL
jgi:hypothetical protein